MIHPGSSLDKAINNTRVKMLVLMLNMAKFKRKRNFIYKK